MQVLQKQQGKCYGEMIMKGLSKEPTTDTKLLKCIKLYRCAYNTWNVTLLYSSLMLTAHVLSPAVKYLFKLNNKVKTVSIVNFEQVNSG